MRFAIGDVTVDVIVDDNDFELSLRGFLPNLDLEPLRDERSWPEPGEFRPERFVGWHGDRFSLIPQGGGDTDTGHRCPGEQLTIELMTTAVRVLTRRITYDVPVQDLGVSLARIPGLPASRFVIENVQLSA